MSNTWTYFSQRHPIKDSTIEISWSDGLVTMMDFVSNDVVEDDFNKKVLPVKWRYKDV